MRKKNILGNFTENPNMLFTHSIRKALGKANEYSALINFLPGCENKFVDAVGQQIQWAGEDYKILMYLPIRESWCLSAYYSPNDELLFWYFDISRKNFVDEYGMPCTDDIYLDLAITPSGQALTLDEDELQEALDNGEITSEDFNNAYRVHDQIKNSKWSNVDFLNEISRKLLLEYKLSD